MESANEKAAIDQFNQSTHGSQSIELSEIVDRLHQDWHRQLGRMKLNSKYGWAEEDHSAISS